MPKVDITGENVLDALTQASGMTWRQLETYFLDPKLWNGDGMGLINCLYELAEGALVSFDNLPRNLIAHDGPANKAMRSAPFYVQAVDYYREHPKIVMRASDTWRRVDMALRVCWNGNSGGMPRKETYSLKCKPVFKMPRADVPRWDIFVAMPFSESLDPVYRDHICSVSKKLSLNVGRADELFSEQSIMDEVWALIISSQILITDCTGKNPNVFYEMGIAHTVGKPIVVITQSPDDVPFDLRHRRYLQYQLTPRGMAKFEKALEATLSNLAEQLQLKTQFYSEQRSRHSIRQK